VFGNSIVSCGPGGGYVSKTGTSQAAPHVSGACAILMTLFPGIGPAECERQLVQLANERSKLLVLSDIIPESCGIAARKIILKPGEQLTLLENYKGDLLRALPVVWQSDDETVVSISGGNALSAQAEGIASISALGFVSENSQFEVQVLPAIPEIRLGSQTVVLEADAFEGNPAIERVYASAGILSFGARCLAGCPSLSAVFLQNADTVIEKDFLEGSDGAVVVAVSGGKAIDYAEEYGIPYLEVEGFQTVPACVP